MTEHGDMAGYWQHRKAKDPPCSACREAYNAYKRAARSPRHSSAGDDETVELNSLGRPVAAYAGYYATDSYGNAYAQMDEDGTWVPLKVGRRLTVTEAGNDFARDPDNPDDPKPELTPTELGFGRDAPGGGWFAMFRSQLKGVTLYREEEVFYDGAGKHARFSLTDRTTGEMVWEGWEGEPDRTMALWAPVAGELVELASGEVVG